MADPKMLGTLLGMVLAMCRQLGLDEKATARMFSPANIKEGFAILDRREQP
jgi:hypothetical protein